MGISLQGLLPVVASAGLMWEGDPPVQDAGLLTLLREVFFLDYVDTGRLQEVKSAAIYKEFTLTPPTPLVERLRPDLAWHIIWPRLDGPSLEAQEVFFPPPQPARCPGQQTSLDHWGVAVANSNKHSK
jgi:hypothetical protein